MKINTDGLFLPNNHSRHEIGWKKVPLEIENGLRGIIAAHYSSSGDIKKIEQVNEWEKQSNNFRVTFSSGKEMLLRKFIKLREAEKIKLLNSIIFFLGSNRVPVSLPVSTDDNRIFFFEGDYFYEAFEFVSGNHFSGDKEELREVAKCIALFHNAMALFVHGAEQFPNSENFMSRDDRVWNEFFELAEEKNTLRDKMLLDNKSFILNIISYIQEYYKGNALDDVQLIHCDIHPLNFILENGKIRAIFDFDGIRMGELLRDIGNAMHRLVRQYVVFYRGQRPVEHLFKEGKNIFLGEYLRHNSINSSLRSMPIYIFDELLRKIYTGLSPYYYEGVDRYDYMIDGPEAQLPKMINLLKEVEFI